VDFSLVTYVTPTLRQHYAEARVVSGAARQHKLIPGLEDVEREQVPWKQDRTQWENRQTLSHLIPVRQQPVLGPDRFVRGADAGLSSTL
jgi:hypothetical protein